MTSLNRDMKQPVTEWKDRFYYKFIIKTRWVNASYEDIIDFFNKELQATESRVRQEVEKKYKANSDKFEEMIMNAARFSHELEYPPTEDEELKRDHEAIEKRVRQEIAEKMPKRRVCEECGVEGCSIEAEAFNEALDQVNKIIEGNEPTKDPKGDALIEFMESQGIKFIDAKDEI